MFIKNSIESIEFFMNIKFSCYIYVIIYPAKVKGVLQQ